MLDKEFVPKEQTKELYDLGFRYNKGFEALACYYGGGLVKLVTTHGLPAPTYSQAFRWFRGKGFRFQASMHWIDGKGIEWWQYRIFGNCLSHSYISYEESELACLRKLIEIVKEKNNG